MSGAVLSVPNSGSTDRVMFTSWAQDFKRESAPRRQLLMGEIEMRMRRMALERYEIFLPAATEVDTRRASWSAMRHIDRISSTSPRISCAR